MFGNLTFSARDLASLLARVFGPEIYDAPPWSGDPFHVAEVVAGRRARFDAVALNPQPLPPRERYALALADAHIQDLVALDRLGGLMGGEVTDRATERALRLVAEVDEICPRWPRWPKNWPPPPPPPWQREDMTATELLLFGTRFLAAAEVVESEKLRESLAALGETALGLSLQQG